jgi:phosphoglucosamine mutase
MGLEQQILCRKTMVLKFGTDGIRGKSDQFPFTPSALRSLGAAIAQWGTEKYKNSQVLLGHDTRISCDMIKKHLIAGLSDFPIKICDGNVLPTPAILQLIKNSDYNFGIVISASHNPYKDNGIKLFDAQSGKLSEQDEAIIVKNFNNFSQKERSFQKIYQKNITKHFLQNFLDGKKIVLDCANGATFSVAPKIFSSLGAEVVTINTTPDGKNINKNCGALHLEQLQKAVLKENADAGFAFDGDGDRVIAVNKNSKIKNGDDLLAILLQHKDLKNERTIVGTIMTNHGFEHHLKKNNKSLIRTKVGDKYVAAQLEEQNLMLGGEASGHIIIKNYLNTGDGIFVALKVLESVMENNNWEMKTFVKTPQFLINVPIVEKKDLNKEPLSPIIQDYKTKLIDGRIVVRYSGTENLLRVMVEDQTIDSAHAIAKNLSAELEKRHNQL